MMMSLSIPRLRISVTKQRSHSLHFCPIQASVRASSLCQSALASGKLRKFRPVTGRSRLLPRGNCAILLNLLQSAQHRLVRKVVELLAAQIIVAALHVANRKPGTGSPFSRQRLLQERNVLVEKLFLQILRASGDDHTLAGPNHRHQIRKSFACAGTGLHDEVTLFFQRLLDRLRHLQLAASKFIGGMRARQDSSRGKELVKRSALSVRRGERRRCSRGGLGT
jgi:hypothetical protein